MLCADRSGDFTGKPRPALVVQRTAYLAKKDSVIVCPLSTVLIDDALSLRIYPAATNGLKVVSDIRADLVSSVRKSRLGKHIGSLATNQMTQFDAILRDWLGI